MNSKQTLFVAAVAGALMVAIGAFGAHALPRYLEQQSLSPEQFERRLHDMDVGVRYHAYHVFALLGLGLWLRGSSCTRSIVGPLFLLGIAMFSGSLYAYVLTGARVWVPVIPVGGLTHIVAWVVWAYQIAKSTAAPGGFPQHD